MKSSKTSAFWRVDAIGAALLVAVAAGVWFVGVRPVVAARAHVPGDQAAYNDAHQHSVEVAADVANCREQLAAIEHHRADKRIAIEPAGRLNHRLATLNDLASKSDVRLDELLPAKLVAGKRYDLLPIHVTGTGGFQAAVAFLHRLHAACPDIAVGTVNVQGQPSLTTRPAKFSLDLTWYAQSTASPKSEAK